MSHEQIATALNISRNTLEKHFSVELSIGGAKVRMEVLNAMVSAAKKGNVTAQKAYLATEPRPAAPPAPPAEAPAPKAAAKGKKIEAQEAAVTAQTGTDWEQLLPRSPLVQ